MYCTLRRCIESGRCADDDVIAVSAADVTDDVFVAEVLNPGLTSASGQRLCDLQYPCSSTRTTLCHTRYSDHYSFDNGGGYPIVTVRLNVCVCGIMRLVVGGF